MSSISDSATLALLILLIGNVLIYATRIEVIDDKIHECSRPCVQRYSARRLCTYEFIVSEAPSVDRSCNFTGIESERTKCRKTSRKATVLAINGRSPGPSIEICLGDTIEVFLYNRLGTDEISLHWHGIRQENSVHMDGVSMVTQCPILPYSGFRYRIQPKSLGTYIYYAHSVSQQGDGVYGSLTVRGPQDDPTLERMLVLSSRPSTPLTLHSRPYPPTPTEILVNGQFGETTMRVKGGQRYLLRLVNANAFNCPLSVSTTEHSFKVLSADGNPVQPVIATHIILFPGERFDVTFEANQPPGKYPISIQGLQECRNLFKNVVIQYDDLQMDSQILSKNLKNHLNDDQLMVVEKGYDCYKVSQKVVCALDLKARKRNDKNKDQEELERRIYVPFDINHYPAMMDEMSDYSFSIYDFTFYPGYMSISPNGTSVAQINRMSFKYPSSPILSQPEATTETTICTLEDRSYECAIHPLFCECLQIIEITPRRSIEFILIDEGFGGNVSHTFHSHGYNVSILGQKSFEHPITKEEIMLLDENEGLHRNYKNPPKKDTFVVPNKGYIIARFYADNIGYWLWESRSTGISPDMQGPGMQFLIRVGSPESLPTVPIDFPVCGTLKSEKMIFVLD